MLYYVIYYSYDYVALIAVNVHPMPPILPHRYDMRACTAAANVASAIVDSTVCRARPVALLMAQLSEQL